MAIQITHNVYVYETFGISKHLPVKLPLFLIRAEMSDNPLTAKCFIYDVVRSYFFSAIIVIAFSSSINSLTLKSVSFIKSEISSFVNALNVVKSSYTETFPFSSIMYFAYQS